MEGVWIKVEELEKLRQQAERIKELEAENAQLSQDLAWRNDELNKKDQQFATLRQRIADAPVVAHITEDGKVFSNGFVRDTDKPLISKEDLQK